MGGYRARDADRERYVDVIQTAYVDGQLGEADRELRVSRALVAETLDELDLLTRDLQNQPAPVVVQPPAPRVVVPEQVALPEPVPWPVPPRRRSETAFLGWVAAAIVVMAIAGLVMAPADEPESIYGGGTFSVDAGVPAADYELTDAGVRRFIRRYGAKFGTTEAYRVTFVSYRVVVHVPVEQARYEVWTWDGDWVREGRPLDVDGPTAMVDLGTLDVVRLFDNLRVARRELGVPDADVQRVEVLPESDGGGTVEIHVRNGRSDRAVLETTLQGDPA
ncbi:DUF1707 domain-containing protein [Nocardioides KLBMP 9356]|uniref:DUF1707 domain-containing protein n=1 Tax=Nocardioides potassii TaxID=2911371 RepID=A0ABS9HHT0_9ACTN|nr:DUF1707 domain-containing protein [Nocardioides potassii]MCF6379819.1 DUF1707 domain-containing protein [Nocardioides potassii]